MIKETSATFGFTSTLPGATFRCRLTKYLERPTAFKPCSSPITYYGFVHDLYTFQVQAITSSGFVQPSATGYTFAVHRGHAFSKTVPLQPVIPSAVSR